MNRELLNFRGSPRNRYRVSQLDGLLNFNCLHQILKFNSQLYLSLSSNGVVEFRNFTIDPETF